MKILVVDDQVNILTLVQLVLEDEGYDVHTVSSGIEAITRTETQVYDRILLDLMMPKMTGYDTLSILRKESRTRHVAIVAFTAKILRGDESDMLKEGFDGYLEKPFRPEELTHIIKKHLT